MIANWNKVVTNQDTVYHLGDFGELDKMKPSPQTTFFYLDTSTNCRW
jgi:calcineurin-like phosphoesterase family protein